MKKGQRFAHFAAACGIGLLAAATPSRASGPRAETFAEKIEVTGSRIKRATLEGPLPVTVVTREEIDRSAAQTLTDVLNTLAMVNTGSFFDVGSSISLRGLGVNATLVLINGRRVSPYGFPTGLVTAYVDLNAIPLAAIERIEVLKDGASAIYGSDAIAGVVNIVLRKDYDGFEATGAYHVSDRGDAVQRVASLLVGRGDLARDGFNVTGVFEYLERDPLLGRDRSWLATDDRRAFGGPDFRSASGSPGTWLTASRFIPADQRLATNTVFPACPAESRDQALDPEGTCAYNTLAESTTLAQIDRKSLFARGEVAPLPTMTAFAELSWNRNRSLTQLPPTPDNGILLPVGHNSNPFPFAVPIRYRFVDVGPRRNHVDSETGRAVLGVRGGLSAWEWEAAHALGRNDVTDRSENYISRTARDALIAGNEYDFVNPSRNDPALLSSLRVSPTRRGISRLRTWDARMSGTLVETAAGPVAAAFGGEHRHERVADIPDPLNAAGLVLADSVTSSAGSRSMAAVFAELSIPVTTRGEVQLAVRSERFDGFGSSTVPKAAAAYRPRDSLLLRAGYNEGFRAPSLPELHLGPTQTFERIVDSPRCDAYAIAFGPSDTRTQGACGNLQVPAVRAGNPELHAESSRAFTLGAVWDATPSLSLAVDYYRVRHRDRIELPNLQFVVANEDRFPGRVIRDPAQSTDALAGTRGPISSLRGDFVNIARQSTAGVELDVRYHMRLDGIGRFELFSTNSYLDYLRNAVDPDAPELERAGIQGVPRYRGSHGIAWSRGDWAGSTLVRVTGRHRERLSGITMLETPSWAITDVQAVYSGFRNTRLAVGVRNLFDRVPPEGLLPTAAEVDFAGRFFYLRITYAMSPW